MTFGSLEYCAMEHMKQAHEVSLSRSLERFQYQVAEPSLESTRKITREG